MTLSVFLHCRISGHDRGAHHCHPIISSLVLVCRLCQAPDSGAVSESLGSKAWSCPYSLLFVNESRLELALISTSAWLGKDSAWAQARGKAREALLRSAAPLWKSQLSGG